MMKRFHRFRQLREIHRYLSTAIEPSQTSLEPTQTSIALSKRQDFKSQPVHSSILAGIETLGIGIPPRKMRSGSFLPSSSKQTMAHRPSPPLPFGTKPRLVRHVGTSDKMLTGASDSTTEPKLKLPEVAIAGRSNVGKSTLLNALLFDANKLRKGQKAAVSNRPGETNQIAIYELEQRLRIVDLPGYGFAYGKKQFQELVIGYLAHRGNVLKRVLLLIDARHGMKTSDFEFLDTLQEAPKVPPLQVILTKCDEVKQKDLARRVAQVKQQLSDALRREPKSFPVMLVSVKPPRQVAGVLELQKSVANLAKKKKGGETRSKSSTTPRQSEQQSSKTDSSHFTKRSKYIWNQKTRATGTSTTRPSRGETQSKSYTPQQSEQQSSQTASSRFTKRSKSTWNQKPRTTGASTTRPSRGETQSKSYAPQQSEQQSSQTDSSRFTKRSKSTWNQKPRTTGASTTRPSRDFRKTAKQSGRIQNRGTKSSLTKEKEHKRVFRPSRRASI